MESKHYHQHRNKAERIKSWLKKNKKIVFILIILLVFCLAFILDRQSKNFDNKENIQTTSSKENYEAIISVVDGEGEESFTKTWGKLISDGYPICSTLVIDYVGKEGFMDWETIEALNDVGVEFVYHTSSHTSFYNETEEEMDYEIQRGIKAMEEHNLQHRIINWCTNTNKDICAKGSKYFEGGIVDLNSTHTFEGDKSNKMMIRNIIIDTSSNYYPLTDLISLINITMENNGWLVLCTRNNYKMMDDTQMEIFRQAFEYAKEHNVEVVTASEGFDLYFGNKLGNN